MVRQLYVENEPIRRFWCEFLGLGVDSLISFQEPIFCNWQYARNTSSEIVNGIADSGEMLDTNHDAQIVNNVVTQNQL